MNGTILPAIGSCIKIVKVREEMKKLSSKNIEGRTGRVVSKPVADPQGRGTYYLIKLDGDFGLSAAFIDEIEVLLN